MGDRGILLTPPVGAQHMRWPQSPGGGTGRRTRFRVWRPQNRGGSNPLLGTHGDLEGRSRARVALLRSRRGAGRRPPPDGERGRRAPGAPRLDSAPCCMSAQRSCISIRPRSSGRPATPASSWTRPRAPPARARGGAVLGPLGGGARRRAPARSLAPPRRCATSRSPTPPTPRARSSSWRRRPTCPRGSRRSSSARRWPAWWTSPARSGSPIPPTTRPKYGPRTPRPKPSPRRATGSPSLHAPGSPVPGSSRTRCYATSIALFAVAPLVKAGVVSPEGIVVTGLSGVSGAGRKAAEDYSFVEVEGDLRAYRLGRHQHVPEIEQTVLRHAGACGPIAFAPVLVLIRRGILSLGRARSRWRRSGRSRGRAARRVRAGAVRARPRRRQGDGEGRAPHEPRPRRRRGRSPRRSRLSPRRSTTS